MGESGLGGLSVGVRAESGTLKVAMSGVGDLRDSSPLADLLFAKGVEARAMGLSQIEVDVRAVEFMNSSALNAFVRWFAELKAQGEEFKVRFLADPTKRWQRGSLNALATFAPETVTVVGNA